MICRRERTLTSPKSMPLSTIPTTAVHLVTSIPSVAGARINPSHIHPWRGVLWRLYLHCLLHRQIHQAQSHASSKKCPPLVPISLRLGLIPQLLLAKHKVQLRHQHQDRWRGIIHHYHQNSPLLSHPYFHHMQLSPTRIQIKTLHYIAVHKIGKGDNINSCYIHMISNPQPLFHAPQVVIVLLPLSLVTIPKSIH